MKKKLTKKDYDLAYERGEPLISDEEYDAKFGLNSTGKILDEETPWEKCNHKIPMASLNKVPLDDFKTWVKKNKLQSCQFVASYKYDGMALVLYYKKGKLINAVTRGDGSIGEDITRNVLKMQNVLPEIKDKNVTALIGEAIIPRKTYNKHLKNKYKNIRNAGAGIAKRFKGETECHHLCVRYYGLVTNGEINSEQEKFEKLKEFGLENIFYKKCDGADDVESFFARASEDRDNKNFEADGIVVTIDEVLVQNGMGRDPSGNPKFSVAVKYSNPTKQTKLKDIVWSMGKAGTITPVAKVEPVDLGVTVENISLANLDVIKKLWNGEVPKRGDVVEVVRSGDVIPLILRVVKKNDKNTATFINTPSQCPTCNESTLVDGPFLICGNSVCDSRKLGDLYKWADKIKDHFKVKGLGPERIDQMFEAGIVQTVDDLYTLQPEDLIGEISGVKEKSAENILAFQKHKEFPLPLFLSCLNIPSISESIFTLVTDSGHDTLEKVMKLSVEELAQIGGLGEIRAKTIVEWLKKKEKLIEEVLAHITIKKPVKKKLDSVTLKGKSFCFTGKLSQSRGHYETIVKNNGGDLKGISKSLDFLVVGENAGSKLEKANAFGIKILTEKEFMEQVKT